jgi:hypothetical protein
MYSSRRVSDLTFIVYTQSQQIWKPNKLKVFGSKKTKGLNILVAKNAKYAMKSVPIASTSVPIASTSVLITSKYLSSITTSEEVCSIKLCRGKACQWLATDRWFWQNTEILLKVTINIRSFNHNPGNHSSNRRKQIKTKQTSILQQLVSIRFIYYNFERTCWFYI